MQDLVSFYRDIDPETRIVLVQVLRVIAILVLAWILQIVAARLIRIFRTYMARRTGGDEVARIETLARVFRNTAVIVIFIVAGTLVLGELGISIAPILATAGVAGVAIGFGAQSLIKDFLGGFFLLLDDQVREGDVVEVAGLSGLVEEVTLRYVRLRNFEGHVHFVPNGEIKTVTNRTRGFAHAVIEVGVAYREDPDEALAVMKDVARAMRADSDLAGAASGGSRGGRRREAGRLRRRAARAPQGGAADRAVECAPRVPEAPEEGVRRAQHRDPLPPSDDDAGADKERGIEIPFHAAITLEAHGIAKSLRISWMRRRRR